MKNLIILFVAVIGMIAELPGQNNFMEEYLSPEILKAVNNFDSVSTNLFLMEDSKSNLQIYFEFEDGPQVWCSKGYDCTLKNVFRDVLINRNSFSNAYYYKSFNGFSDRVSLTLGSKIELERCLIKWGKIIDAGFINNNSQVVSLLHLHNPILLTKK